QAVEATGFDGLGELVDTRPSGTRAFGAADYARIPEQSDRFWAHAGKFEQLEDAGAEFGQQLVALLERTGGGDGLELGSHALADAVDLHQARGIRSGRDQVDRGLLGGIGGAAVAAD